MRKIVITLLAIFIICIFSYIIIRYYGSVADEDNWFNDNYRNKIVSSPTLRSFFNLRWDGDAKTDYLLHDKFTKILIEVDSSDSCSISQEALDTVKVEIQKITNKPDGIEFVNSDILPLLKESYTREEVRTIAKIRQNRKSSDGAASLYILCLNSFEEHPSYVGQTVFEDGIVLFSETIKKVAGNNPISFDIYVSSTILHEFGHQLGLDHSDRTNCLMSERVESPGNDRGALNFIPKIFCREEVESIEQIRNSLYND